MEAPGELPDQTVYIITSTGRVRGVERSVELIVAKINLSIFNDALLGCDGVSISSNGKTSSYSSADPTKSNHNGNISTTNPDADIYLASNAVVKGDVRAARDLIMESNAIVYKSAYSNRNIQLKSNAAIGYDDREVPYTYEAKASGYITLGSNAQIFGTQTPNASPPPVSPPACDPLNINDLFANNADPFRTANDNSELNPSHFDPNELGYHITGNNRDIFGTNGLVKKFYLTSFQMDSNAKVTIRGNVVIYVEGDFSMKSNTEIIFDADSRLTIYVSGKFSLDSNTKINENGIPSNLRIYSRAQSSIDGDYKVIINSNSGFAGVVYAPKASVLINSDGQIDGSVRGKFVKMDSNGEFRYDEELRKLTDAALSVYKILSWREL